MPNEKREDPDLLLKKIRMEESEITNKTVTKGSLKIFLGYCAGVGKTFKMLQQAQANKKIGIDVVIGIAETHGRSETESLLNGLEILQRKTVHYQGIILQEMDIDAALKRKPKLVIVDELAHTNAPGSRHLKRYQDVEELLNAGINVYTTLNVQHIESLIDIVYKISGVKMQETVPDSFLELAGEIELVDLTPEQLLERLHEGKVYIPQKAEQALRKFFKKGNLLALRELALRYTARQVTEEVRTYMEKSGILGPLPAGARFLVGISSSSTSERLIRLTHRIAADLDAEWFAVHVESPQQVRKNINSLIQLDKNIKLAEELNAKFVSLSGNNIANEIAEFSRKNNVTLIIAGLSYRSRIQELIKGSVLNELVKKAKPINVLIVNDEVRKPTAQQTGEIKRKTNFKAYLLSLLGVALTSAIGLLFRSSTEPVNIGMLLLLPVIISGILWGTRVTLFASIIAVASFDFFFIPPYLTFRVSDIKYLPSFGTFIFIAVVISFMAKLVRWQIERLRYRESFLSALFSFSNEIIAAENLEEILKKATKHISDVFESSAVILLPGKNGNLELKYQSENEQFFNETEHAISTWVYKNGKEAGKHTDTLSASKFYFYPLKIKDKSIGVLGLRSLEPSAYLTSEQIRLLESFGSVIALAVVKKW